jgi:hypothetical protein
MIRKIENSWALIKASWRVLGADKELVVFPIVSAVGVLLVTATFVFPMLLGGIADSLISEQFQILTFLIGFAFYIAQYFVIFFANAALIGAAMIRLRGGDPTVGDGFRSAGRHIFSILGYALISATVGMILRAISERGRTVGNIVSSILGMAWNIATYLVVPILVIEGVGPLDAIKLSANKLKETWGEQLAGNFGIGAVSGLVAFLILLIGIPAIALAFMAESALLIGLAIMLVILALVFLALISSTLNGIYVAAVYHYAADGEVSDYFSEEMVRQAFLPKG